MQQEIITPSILDEILLEDKFHFKAITKICNGARGGFTIIFDFVDLSADNFKNLISLCQQNKALKFCSAFFTEQNLDIKEIIVSNFRTDENKTMRWECLSR